MTNLREIGCTKRLPPFGGESGTNGVQVDAAFGALGVEESGLVKAATESGALRVLLGALQRPLRTEDLVLRQHRCAPHAGHQGHGLDARGGGA